MEAIVAVFSDWGIGSEGSQQIVLKADRKHFRELTAGAAVLVGRKTLEDFPNGTPLKGRDNLVLTSRQIEIPGARVVHSTEEVVAAAAEYPRCLVIGGASVYRQLLPWIDKVHITQIDRAPASDSFFPDLENDPHWSCVEQGAWQEENGVPYRFCTYIRIAPEE